MDMNINIDYAPVPYIESKDFVDISSSEIINGKKFTFVCRYESSDTIGTLFEHFKRTFENAVNKEWTRGVNQHNEQRGG